jgi:hypothetical protein
MAKQNGSGLGRAGEDFTAEDAEERGGREQKRNRGGTEENGLAARREVELPVISDGVQFDFGYRVNLLVEDAIIVEFKSVESLAPLHQAQLLTYLKLSGRKIGLTHQLLLAAPQRRHQAPRQQPIIAP